MIVEGKGGWGESTMVLSTTWRKSLGTSVFCPGNYWKNTGAVKRFVMFLILGRKFKKEEEAGFRVFEKKEKTMKENRRNIWQMSPTLSTAARQQNTSSGFTHSDRFYCQFPCYDQSQKFGREAGSEMSAVMAVKKQDFSIAFDPFCLYFKPFLSQTQTHLL